MLNEKDDFMRVGHIYMKHLANFSAMIAGFKNMADAKTIESLSVTDKGESAAGMQLFGVSYLLRHRFNPSGDDGKGESTVTAYRVDDLDDEKLMEVMAIRMTTGGNVLDCPSGHTYNGLKEFNDIFVQLFGDN